MRPGRHGRFSERARVDAVREPSPNLLARRFEQGVNLAKAIEWGDPAPGLRDELRKMVAEFGLDTVRAYMRHVQDNAEAEVRRVIGVLKTGRFDCELDDGSRIRVGVSIDPERQEATIDFTGTSAQQPTNFNAPSAVCRRVRCCSLAPVSSSPKRARWRRAT